MSHPINHPLMKFPLLLLPFLILPLCAQETPKAGGNPPAAEKPAKELVDFIRYTEKDQGAMLETAIRSYTNPDGIVVDLVGVVHIADASYYKKLNAQLSGYDAVLYELVGDPAALKAPQDAKDNPLRGIQKMAGQMLKLSFQLDHIDYSQPNFIHADLSAERFAELQKEKGESLMSLFSRAMKMQDSGKLGIDKKDMEMDLSQILAGLSSAGGPDSLKIVMAKVFDKAESMVDSFEGDDEKNGTVLLTERNKVVSAKLQESIKDGKRHLAIFYGAGHLSGLDVLVKDMKFASKGEQWLPAWTMKLPAKK